MIVQTCDICQKEVDRVHAVSGDFKCAGVNHIFTCARRRKTSGRGRSAGSAILPTPWGAQKASFSRDGRENSMAYAYAGYGLKVNGKELKRALDEMGWDGDGVRWSFMK